VKTLFAVIVSLLPITSLAQQTAQVFVSTRFSSINIRPGDAAAFEVLTQNLGAIAAENCVVSITPPPGVTAHVTGAPCDESKIPIQCSLGTIASHDTKFLFVTETLPSTVGSYVTKLSVVSTTPDSQPFHEHSFEVRVSGDPDLSLMLDAFPPTRFDPNASFGRSFVVRNSSGSDAHSVEVMFNSLQGFVLKDATYGAFTCTSGTRTLCVTPLLRAGETLTFQPDIRVGSSTDGGALRLDASLVSAEPEYNANDNRAVYFGVAYRTFTVSTTADAGFGTLREAIIQSASGGCKLNEQPCKIVFAIAEPVPSNGWYTIEPLSPLPAVQSADLIIDARTQTAFSGDTNPAGPELELSGQRVRAGSGFVLLNGPRNQLQGFAINGFPDYGVVVAGGGFGFQSLLVDGNYIGTDPTGTRAVPNGRGIAVSNIEGTQISNNLISGNARSGIFIATAARTGITKNRIGVRADGATPLPNGASGVFISDAATDTLLDQNDIAFNGEFAVAIAPATKGAFVRRTTMRDNGIFAIDIGLDRATPNSTNDSDRLPNAPVLASARYDAVTDTTTITGTTPNACGFCNLDVDIYASNTLASNGAAQAERYLGTARAGGFVPVRTFTLLTKGSLIGQLITATTTRSEIPRGLSILATEVYGTSELSSPISATD
jgi:hypothetical protein